MSEDFTDFYYRQPFHDEPRRTIGASAFTYSSDHSAVGNNLQMFDPNHVSFADFLHGSNSLTDAFGLSPPSSAARGGRESTPNSCTSSSSAEAAAGVEDSNKGKKDVKETLEDDGCKKDSKAKKKGEKKEKKQRFAFMTKSEVDHLEDGYRWRKYGQKAVKNSPYPRSYYRCTTQKCGVKKRVERSYQEPSVVITTYEGQHNHHVPANLRGSAAAMFGPSLLPPPEGQGFSHDSILFQMPHLYAGSGNGAFHQQDQFHQFADYGLLQDIIPPSFP